MNEPYDVPAALLKQILEALKQVSGAQYEHILKQAGWERFLTQPPPDLGVPLAAGREISHLYGTIFRLLGETLTRMFLTNYGREIAGRLIHMPNWSMLASRITETEPAARNRQVAQVVAEQIARTWTSTRLVEDATHFHFVRESCRDCTEIHGAQAPLCASAEQVYSGYARHLLGRRVLVTEVECIAAGAPVCRFSWAK